MAFKKDDWILSKLQIKIIIFFVVLTSIKIVYKILNSTKNKFRLNYLNFLSSWDLNFKIDREFNVYFIKVNIEATKYI